MSATTADDDADPDTTQGTRKEAKLRRIQSRFHRAEEYESQTRVLERDDKKFAHADPDHPQWQWPQAVYNSRNATGQRPKPCIVINKTRQHNLQVINDGRQNKPSVKIHATGYGATAEAAQVYEGLVRHIEYESKASAVYVRSQTDQVDMGIGYWRIVTEYPSDDTFDQEIYIRIINDPHSVYLDPDAQQPDKSDARWGIIFRDLPRDEFKKEFPQYADLAGAQSMEGQAHATSWSDKDTVRIAEYYERTAITDTLWAVPQNAVHPDHPGGTLRESKMIDGLPEALKKAKSDGVDGYQSRDVENIKVTWTMVVGDEIVDEQDTAYNFIPIVPLIGEEIVVDGILDRRGHTRALKDAQRMYNYNASAAVEFGALQTRIPWLVNPQAIEGFEDYWSTANIVDHAYLPWNKINETGVEGNDPPQRIEPPQTAPIFMEGMQVAENQMQLASGQYDAQMGAPSNERTGIAIQERQRQGDKATYHFIDQLGIAIAYTGRILVDLIPKVYDTKRVIQILGEDGTRTQVQVDPTAAQAHIAPNDGSAPPAPGQPQMPPQPGQQPPAANGNQPGQGGQPDATLIFNPNVGRYSVEAEIGPGYATQREEAANAFTQIITTPNGAPYMDLYFKSQDFPLADEAAERAHNMLPPQALGGPSPEMQQAMQHIQGLTAANTNLMKELADEKTRSKLANDNKSNNNSIDAYKAETDRIAALHDINPELLRPLVSQLVIQALADKYGGSTNVMPVSLPHPNEAPPPPQQMAANDPNQPPVGATA
jgi:hypothetical protein